MLSLRIPIGVLSRWVVNLSVEVSQVVMNADLIDVPHHFSYVFPLLYSWLTWSMMGLWGLSTFPSFPLIVLSIVTCLMVSPKCWSWWGFSCNSSSCLSHWPTLSFPSYLLQFPKLYKAAFCFSHADFLEHFLNFPHCLLVFAHALLKVNLKVPPFCKFC